MGAQKAYTLLEIIMVSTLMILVCSLSVSLYVYFSRSADREDREQIYYQKLTALEARIRQDLRSAYVFNEDAPGVYSIKTIYLDENGIASLKEVIYWVDESGRGVQRHVKDSTESRTFDFSGLLPENEQFIFRIK